MDRKIMCICSVIIAICILWTGCGQSAEEPVFSVGAETVSGAEDAQGEDIQVDEETLRAVIEEALASVEISPVIEVTCGCTGETQVYQVTGAASVNGSAVPADDGKVDINTADAAALQSLNGIGETRAQAIISYRENCGAFQTIEDIKRVDGIKDGVFDKIKDQISVG